MSMKISSETRTCFPVWQHAAPWVETRVAQVLLMEMRAAIARWEAVALTAREAAVRTALEVAEAGDAAKR